MKTFNEFLAELKTPTLLSYTQKAANKLAFHGDGSKKAMNRATGVKRAAARLTKRSMDPTGEFGYNKNVKQEEVVNERDYHIGQGEKIQKRTLKWMKDRSKPGEHVGAPGLNAMNARTAEHKARRGVKKVRVKEDKALAFVIDKLKKQYPGGVLTKGDKMPEPSAAQKKKNAEIRAQRAKEDHRDETEKATSGRYNDRSRSD